MIFVNNATIEAELKFNELLETEKSKYQNETKPGNFNSTKLRI